MKNKFITLSDNGTYLYDRYEALINHSKEILDSKGLREVQGKYNSDEYTIVKLPDELHILCYNVDLANMVGASNQYEEGDYDTLLEMYNSDIKRIKEVIDKLDNTSYSNSQVEIMDDWYDYFCSDEEAFNEMMASWGVNGRLIEFENMEEFNRFWHEWGRYFICDILK